jgi:phosphate butyryltransferase
MGKMRTIAVAAAHDEAVLQAVVEARRQGIAHSILCGKEAVIREMLEQLGETASDYTILPAESDMDCAASAVEAVREGRADFLMKGLCSTDKFLRAILNKETGLLPPKGTLTHCAVFEMPCYHKLLFVGDVAVIPAPDMKQKQVIMECLVRTAKAVGVAKPKVAIIAATEQVLPSQPASIDAALLAKMVDRGQIKGCIADGPLALDVAIDMESVKIKGLVSEVAGDPDCLLFPNIESGNVFYKANSKLVPGVKQAGMLVGAKVPCVLSSRADSIETKLNSIAMAAMAVR